MDNRIFLCIDLKSFYASVECIERGLDPMTTIADRSCLGLGAMYDCGSEAV